MKNAKKKTEKAGVLRRLEQIEKLPAAQQVLLLKTIDTFIKAAGK